MNRLFLGMDKNECVLYSVSKLERKYTLENIFSPICSFRLFKFNIFSSFEYVCQEFSFPCPYWPLPNYQFIFADEVSSLLIVPNLPANYSLPLNQMHVSLLNVETGNFETFLTDYDFAIPDGPNKVRINYKCNLFYYSPNRGWTLLVVSENMAYVFDMIFIRGNLFRGITAFIKFKLRSLIEPGPDVHTQLIDIFNADYCMATFSRNGIACCCYDPEQLLLITAVLNLETNTSTIRFQTIINFPIFPVHVEVARKFKLFVRGNGDIFIAHISNLKNNAEKTVITEARIFKLDIASDDDGFIFQRMVNLDLNFNDIIFNVFECSQCTAYTFADNENYQIFITWKNNINLQCLALKSVCTQMPLDLTEAEQVGNLHIPALLARDCFGPQWMIKAGKPVIQKFRKPWYRKLF